MTSATSTLNGDGLPDLMLEDNGGGSGSPGEFCLNQPGSPGTFVCAVAPFPTVTYQGSPWGFASNDQKVADLDNDGDDDLVFGSRGDAFACWSDGAGALSCSLLTGAPNSAIETGSAYEVDVAELNGDALPDVLVTHVDNRSGITQCLNKRRPHVRLHHRHPLAAALEPRCARHRGRGHRRRRHLRSDRL